MASGQAAKPSVSFFNVFTLLPDFIILNYSYFMAMIMIFGQKCKSIMVIEVAAL